MSIAPVVLFTYNRLAHTQKTVSYLQKNDLANQTPLYIYSDGPNKAEDLIKVNEVRNYLRTIEGFASVKIFERERNIGLAESIITGVTEILNSYDMVIVVEDDLLTSQYFLTYMNDALSFYENNNEVISIHGYVYPVAEQLPDTFFIKGADCWGWATWKRGWSLFEKDGTKLLNELKSRSLTEAFDFDNAYYFTQMLEDQIAGKNNSWAIRWNASAFLKDKLTLYPGHSLVQNIGHDNSGVHSSANQSFDVDLYQHPLKITNILVQQSEIGYRAFRNYFNKTNPFKPKQNFIKRFLKKVFN